MADFEALTAAEEQALRHYDYFALQRRRFKLARLRAFSRLRLAQVFATGLNPKRAHDAEGLALLATHSAHAYRQLAPLRGAIRFAASAAERAFRATRLTVGAEEP